jgi:LuxR family maltose regulon positive regulatory protein
MAPLLSRILARPRDLSRKARPAARRNIAADYVPKLLTILAAETTLEAAIPQLHPAPWIESLTERELEVLRLLSTSLSTAEIANQLYIAVSTLRTHTKSIYGKLDVHSRREATARAQEWQLL